MSQGQNWAHVCALADIMPNTGVCALIDGQQVAIFRLADAVHAIGNHDPASLANVMSRGIVGDLGGEPVATSPIYKHHYSLITGRCVEDPELAVPVYLARIVEGEVWVNRRSMEQRRRAGKRRLVVIGNGMAAVRTVEGLLELAPQAYEITIFGAEDVAGYNRILLSSLLAGEKRQEELLTHPAGWYAERGIVLHAGDAVQGIDRTRRLVRSQRGLEVPYDRLLIATGSKPAMLPVPGVKLPGIVSFRDLRDVAQMLDAARRYRRAVVIGGGLLGLEAASGLLRQGMDVTVVHVAATLMNRQLDEHAAALLRAELEQRGLKFLLDARTEAILGSSRVTGVRLADGTELPAELVVMAVGVRPEIELARAAGLRCERGVLVNDTMQTFDPAIYAVGECVQHRDSTYGLVAPLWEQARVCAAHLAEAGVVRYPGSQPATQLKVTGIEVYSAGDHIGTAGSESLVLRDPRRGIYKRLVLQNNRVRGAVLYGDTRDGGWYADLITQGRDVGAMRDRLLFGEAHCTPPG